MAAWPPPDSVTVSASSMWPAEDLGMTVTCQVLLAWLFWLSVTVYVSVT
ncbi:hypothetical protein [Pseudoalteromonas rubra]|nr:hypothetical protein [Pseudoalteromonas rubra]